MLVHHAVSHIIVLVNAAQKRNPLAGPWALGTAHLARAIASRGRPAARVAPDISLSTPAVAPALKPVTTLGTAVGPTLNAIASSEPKPAILGAHTHIRRGRLQQAQRSTRTCTCSMTYGQAPPRA